MMHKSLMGRGENWQAPSGATHSWDPQDGFCSKYVIRLRYYKKVDNDWWCYSNITGWRKSLNDKEWFETETKEGFFTPIVGN